MKSCVTILCLLFSLQVLAQTKPGSGPGSDDVKRPLYELDKKLMSRISLNSFVCGKTKKIYRDLLDFYIKTNISIQEPCPANDEQSISREIKCLFTSDIEILNDLNEIVEHEEIPFIKYMRDQYRLSPKEAQPIWDFYSKIYQVINPNVLPKTQK